MQYSIYVFTFEDFNSYNCSQGTQKETAETLCGKTEKRKILILKYVK